MNDPSAAELPEGPALAELVRAYLETDYHVASPEGSLTFHVGQENSNNDLLLIGAGVERWAIITAWNPRSQPRSWEENDESQQRLKQDIEQRGFKWWEAAGKHPANEWPAEESCLILNISPRETRELCQKYRQLAALSGETGDQPRLLFGDWKQLGPRLKSIPPEEIDLNSRLVASIERNELIAEA